jgi:hypothetical protein
MTCFLEVIKARSTEEEEEEDMTHRLVNTEEEEEDTTQESRLATRPGWYLVRMQFRMHDLFP